MLIIGSKGVDFAAHLRARLASGPAAECEIKCENALSPYSLYQACGCLRLISQSPPHTLRNQRPLCEESALPVPIVLNKWFLTSASESAC
eukprot:35953-Rhodomonas_salina.2